MTSYTVPLGDPWTPADDSFHLWLDGNDGTTITHSSGKLSNWSNKLNPGTADMVQATAIDQPTWGTATVNGKDTVYFDGSGQEIDTTYYTGTYSYFMVVLMDNTKPNHSFGGLPFSNYMLKAESGGSNAPYSLGGSPTALQVNGADYLTGKNTGDVFTAFSAGVGCFFMNNLDCSKVRQIGEFGSLHDLKGSICAIVGNITSFTLDQYQKLEGWAAWEYDFVSRLPAGHPYESDLPRLPVV